MPRVLLQMKTAFARVIPWSFILIGVALLPRIAFADAGTVRITQKYGNYRITVFTDPTPLRAGPVDVSILVQDVGTGEARLDPIIDLAMKPRGCSSIVMRYQASSAAASNKLFQAANIDLPHAGWWEFTVDVQGLMDRNDVHFEAEAAEPLPPWQTLWPWFCWPFLVIALFVMLRSETVKSAKIH